MSAHLSLFLCSPLLLNVLPAVCVCTCACVYLCRCYHGFTLNERRKKNKKSGAQQEKSLFNHHLQIPISNLLLLPILLPSLSPSGSQSVHLSLFLPLCLLHLSVSLYKTDMTLCQILLLDLRGSGAFPPPLSRFSLFYSSLRNTSNKHRHAEQSRAGTTHTHTQTNSTVYVCVDISACL